MSGHVISSAKTSTPSHHFLNEFKFLTVGYGLLYGLALPRPHHFLPFYPSKQPSCTPMPCDILQVGLPSSLVGLSNPPCILAYLPDLSLKHSRYLQHPLRSFTATLKCVNSTFTCILPVDCLWAPRGTVKVFHAPFLLPVPFPRAMNINSVIIHSENKFWGSSFKDL